MGAGVMKKPIQAQLDDLNEEIKKSKEVKAAKFEELQALRTERESKMGGAKDLIEQRKGMKELIDAEYEKIRKLRDEYKKVNDTHWKWEKEKKKIIEEQRWEEYQREQERWEAEQKKWQLEK